MTAKKTARRLLRGSLPREIEFFKISFSLTRDLYHSLVANKPTTQPTKLQQLNMFGPI